tara:strand:+ start:597 stop:899 length:303 start_codon:yes stop_codon:yes gene_type:complete
MSEEVKSFIDQIANGDNASAGDAFKDALRVKVGDSLDGQRKEVASNLFNGTLDAESHSDPKPEIAEPGSFNPDGSVAGALGQDGEAQIDLTPQGQEDAGQ